MTEPRRARPASDRPRPPRGGEPPARPRATSRPPVYDYRPHAQMPPSRSHAFRALARRYGLLALGGLAVLAVLVLAMRSGPSPTSGELTEQELAILTGQASGSASRLQGSTTDGPMEVTTGLSVITSPTGATVSVEFEPVGVSPLEALPLEVGSYFVSVSKPGFASLDTLVFVDPRRISSVYVVLEREGALAGEAGGGVTLEEPLAEADREERRRRAEDAAQRTRQAEAQRTSPTQPAARESRTEARRSEPPAKKPEVVQTGGLRIASEPSGATVLLDGRSVGQTPLTLYRVPPDEYTVALQKDGYTSRSQRVTVGPGEDASYSATLASLSGEVTVLVRPWGSIYINGELRRPDTDVQYRTSLPAGTHTVRVTHPGLGSKERTVDVTAGGSQQIVIDLQ